MKILSCLLATLASLLTASAATLEFTNVTRAVAGPIPAPMTNAFLLLQTNATKVIRASVGQMISTNAPGTNGQHLKTDGTRSYWSSDVTGNGAGLTDLPSTSIVGSQLQLTNGAGQVILSDAGGFDAIVLGIDPTNNTAILYTNHSTGAWFKVDTNSNINTTGNIPGTNVTLLDVKVYTNTSASYPQTNTVYTWTKPAGAQTVRVIAIGGGGGGGAGRRGAAGSERYGGNGGSSGAYSDYTLPASLVSSPQTVTIGGGGAGATGQTVDDSNGADGNPGQATTFGTIVGATSGAKGAGGKATSSSQSGGYAFAGYLMSQGNGGTGQNNNGSSGGSAACGPGGGGGGMTTDNVAKSGGSGGDAVIGYYINGGAGGTSGGNGTPGTSRVAGTPFGGSGGGGGASSATTTAGSGADGGKYGAGGGGGGASVNAQISGAGGNGAPGMMIVITTISR